ncbi:hypothetical protein MBH78_01610 [Oceanimonas sp. NS1]|nr:hypothetical protein [Oceanimonas sp. NS1]
MIDNGIEIDEALWAEINRIGAGILVENSERSAWGRGTITHTGHLSVFR